MANTKPLASQVKYGNGTTVANVLSKSVLSYQNYESASAAAATLPDGQVVQYKDGGQTYISEVLSGTLTMDRLAFDANSTSVAAPAAPSLNLQKWLDDEVVNLRTRFGVSPSATDRANTDNLQTAIDLLHTSRGGGTLRLPFDQSPYYFTNSMLSEVYDNYGATVPAADAAIILRQGIGLVGDAGRRPVVKISGTGATHAILLPSPDDIEVANLEFDGSWGGVSGAGQGIFNVNIDVDNQLCRNVHLHDLKIGNFASYGVGLNNGDMRNVSLERLWIHDIGSDAIDTKQRGPAKLNIGFTIDTILIERFGTRIEGSAGIDLHGVGKVSNIEVRDFGNTTYSTFGVRCRTLTGDGAEGENARSSELSNMRIIANPGFSNTRGFISGSRDVMAVNITARNAGQGFAFTGNSVGSPDRNHLIGSSAIDCDTGVFITTGVGDTSLISVTPVGCSVGVRNEGDRTRMVSVVPVNCTTPFSTAGVAAPTEMRLQSGVSLGLNEVENIAQSRLNLEPRGATDVEFILSPRGTSRLALSDGSGGRKVQVSQQGVGFNAAAPTGKMTLNAAATDAATTTNLLNQIRAGLILNGLAQ